ncbi:PREDICTED: ubiquitin-like domain-containing CTD phosphatase 1 isoform X2 [Nicrophorus vespilloides]|nr:PREDICTED: ubiquitin-like domain-containing CTD phosphatase 1 isoform X2 [Nicrophorus vespilloides]XP_017769585.1 PREDICTED: ubiquitin-like domain-containing CTD phosphatase 1 isoform X2 [Nicrophorus vespilloides]
MTEVSMDQGTVKIIVKWSGKEYELTLGEQETVGELKKAIHKETGVRSDRQKLLNLKLKGKSPDDDCRLSHMKLKQGFKLMMMGSLEEDIAEATTTPTCLPEVVNDLDIEDEEVSVVNEDVYLAKIQKRVKEYKIKMLNEPRENKKLLVLDIDYTLFDHRSAAEQGVELMRPYLHEFLKSAYEDYDIVIWSATGMKWIEEKMKLLGVSTHPDYKIIFYLDSAAMISVFTTRYGVVDVKPLGVIWGKFEQFTSKNTIMFDDIRRNFIMNPKNGLRIRAFRQAHLNRENDKELLYLSRYLRDLAKNCDDFTKVDHRDWDRYRPNSL